MTTIDRYRISIEAASSVQTMEALRYGGAMSPPFQRRLDEYPGYSGCLDRPGTMPVGGEAWCGVQLIAVNCIG